MLTIIKYFFHCAGPLESHYTNTILLTILNIIAFLATYFPPFFGINIVVKDSTSPISTFE